MMTDKDLICRALLGDQDAQKQCTEKGIVMPCPFCGSENIVISNWGLCRVWCQVCLGKSDDQLSQADAIRKWNTRPAPPIGKCGECKFYTILGHCEVHSHEPYQYGSGAYVAMLPEDFCSYFEPKGE